MALIIDDLYLAQAVTKTFACLCITGLSWLGETSSLSLFLTAGFGGPAGFPASAVHYGVRRTQVN